MTAALVILAIGLGTYGLRVSMFALAVARPLPAAIAARLTLVGPAAVAALVASVAFTAHGRVAPRSVPELVAVAAGFAVVRGSGNVVHAFAVGMPIVWIGAAVGC